jgi:hypothetical protein
MKKMYIKGLFDDGANGATGDAGDNNGGTGENDAGANGDGKGEKLYTKAEMDAYTNQVVSKKKAEWDKSHKTAVKDEAERLAAMNAQERAEHDRDEWKAKYDELFKQNTRATLTAEARKIISDAGITGISDELIDRLVGDDAETTKASVDGFVKAYTEAVNAGVVAIAKKPSPKGGTSSNGVTKESIMKIKDPIERQAMMRKHHKLFGF